MRVLLFGTAIGLAMGFALAWSLQTESRPHVDGRAPASNGQVIQRVPVERVDVGDARLDEEVPFEPSSVASLRSEMIRASMDDNWDAYKAMLERLAALDTPGADDELVRILGDVTIEFPEEMGRWFYEWLKDTEVSGVAEAARRRWESREHVRPYFLRLVAIHGDREDLDWIAEMGRVASRSEFSRRAELSQRVLAETQRLEAGRRLAELYRAGPVDPNVLPVFAKNHPRAAFDAIHEILGLIAEGDASEWHIQETGPIVLRSYGDTVPADRVLEAEETLMQLQGFSHKIAAIHALQSLHERRLYTGRARELIEFPVREIEQQVIYGPSSPSYNLRRVLDSASALEMPVARSTRGAVALEQAAIQWERKGDAGLAKDLRETASRIRRALAWTGGDE